MNFDTEKSCHRVHMTLNLFDMCPFGERVFRIRLHTCLINWEHGAFAQHKINTNSHD